MIQNIEIKKLHPHHDNPRKDLGDITELAESIKSKGVLQNLTVVPWFSKITGVGCDDPKRQEEMGYTVVIGHRRLAAAKLAGLTELPCFISDMPLHEQVATMLLENMQRSDLTILEQADGFQMMIDFGETVGTIADKTGFAETTVRHRIKLKELDRAKLEESSVRGGRIEDYIALEKIKDVKARNKLLEYIGTGNFKWQMENALDNQEKPERKKAIIAQLNKFAKPIKEKDRNGMSYVAGFYGFKGDVKKPKGADDVEYFYTVDDHSISLYKKEPKAAPVKKSKKEKDFEASVAMLKELSKRAYELRCAFMKDFSAAKKHAAEIYRMAFLRFLNFSYSREYASALELLGIDKPEGDSSKPWETQELIKDLIAQKYDEQPEFALLAIVFANYDDKPSNSYFSAHSWELSIKYDENKSLNMLYDGLISLGYQMSDEERALRDGTHELFNKPK